MLRSRIGVLAGLIVWLALSPAAAQGVDDATRGAARKLGYDGVDAFQARDYVAADDKLERAYRILQAPSLGLWSARALAKLGKLVEAQERYLDVTRLPIASGDADVQQQAKVDAAAELAALTPRVPFVIVELHAAKPTDVTLTIDGAPLSTDLVGEACPVNPGRHIIVGVKGTNRVEVQVTVAEREQKSARLEFGVAPPVDATESAAPPVGGADAPDTNSTLRSVGWTAFAVGGGAVLIGGVTGVIAISKKSALDGNPRCTNDACGPSQQGEVDSYNSARTFSGVALIGGGLLAATGIVMVLTLPRESRPATSLWLTPGGAALRGYF
ncbi:MAG: hypothetical protein ABI548_15905 [Polyangiaceae bacterium]